jgi:hypothetical protein
MARPIPIRRIIRLREICRLTSHEPCHAHGRHPRGAPVSSSGMARRIAEVERATHVVSRLPGGRPPPAGYGIEAYGFMASGGVRGSVSTNVVPTPSTD